MACDPASGQLILFGGYDQYGDVFDDTWVWDGTNWTQQSPVYPPAPNGLPAMASTPVGGEIVLFGGANNGGPLNETEIWIYNNWSQETPRTVPPARTGHALSAGPRSVGGLGLQPIITLFGGATNKTILGDTWTWDGANWRKHTPANSPPARAYHAMAQGPMSDQVILFGGMAANGAPLNDTWVWQ
jgi:hypothetical protein